MGNQYRVYTCFAVSCLFAFHKDQVVIVYPQYRAALGLVKVAVLMKATTQHTLQNFNILKRVIHSNTGII
jgi:hypothetical protein